MSNLLFADSFTHYNISQMERMWTTALGGNIVQARFTNNGFTGGLASYLFPTPQAELTVGFAWKPSSAGDNLPIKLTTTNNVGFMFQAKGDGTIFPIVTTPGGNTSSAGPTWAQVAGIWYYVEFQVTIAGGSTTYILKINGNQVLSSSIAVGDSANYSYLNIINTAGVISDLYVTDTAFFGDVRVIPCIPASDGDTVTWTPLSGSAHFSQVNQVPADDDTTYVFGSAGGILDLYHYANITLAPAPTLKGVVTCAMCRADSGTSFTASVEYKSGGSTSTSSAVTKATNQYVYILDFQIQNPIGPAAWTISAFNSLQVGVTLGSLTNPSMVVTVPASGVYLMQFGCNFGNFETEVHPSAHSTSTDPTLAGKWNITISGPATGGGTQTKTITIQSLIGSSAGHWDSPTPWSSGEAGWSNNPGMGGVGGGNDVPPRVTTFVSKADGFAFNSGDVITITYNFGVYDTVGGTATGSNFVTGGSVVDFLQFGPSGVQPSRYGTIPPYAGQYDPTTCTGQGNSWIAWGCVNAYNSHPAIGDSIFMGALLGCFTDQSYLTTPGIPGGSKTPGDPNFIGGAIIGRPFSVTFGNGYPVP